MICCGEFRPDLASDSAISSRVAKAIASFWIDERPDACLYKGIASMSMKKAISSTTDNSESENPDCRRPLSGILNCNKFCGSASTFIGHVNSAELKSCGL